MPTHAVLTSPRRIEIQDRPPRPLGPREARIAVAFAGVCGTDLAIYKGDYAVPLPLVPGHEFSGRIVEVGAETAPEWVGCRVVAEINNTCLARGEADPCEACRRRIPRHCQRRTVLGIVACDGAFATEVVVPAANAHLLPQGVSDREAVFVEPVAAALQTFEMGPLGRRGAEGFPLNGPPWVVVLGVGRLGLLVAAVAKGLGARVLGVSRSPDKLERAAPYAPYCEALVSAANEDHAVAEIRRRTGGLGADYVVESTASPRGLALAARLVRPRGTIALKSTPGLPACKTDLTQLVVDEIRLQGSRCGPFPEAIRFIRARKIDLASLIGSIHPLAETAAALEAAAREPKVLIQCAS
ncbi:MAG: alcohol dehydrogenase catalytic domain-containing protein [Candidatus Sumerlaeota bacterium]|nr:alcohol dehydrogenase catalytic domain-containing protein [Candidatus Sumerlaeota bacterium]